MDHDARRLTWRFDESVNPAVVRRIKPMIGQLDSFLLLWSDAFTPDGWGPPAVLFTAAPTIDDAIDEAELTVPAGADLLGPSQVDLRWRLCQLTLQRIAETLATNGHARHDATPPLDDLFGRQLGHVAEAVSGLPQNFIAIVAAAPGDDRDTQQIDHLDEVIGQRVRDTGIATLQGVEVGDGMAVWTATLHPQTDSR